MLLSSHTSNLALVQSTSKLAVTDMIYHFRSPLVNFKGNHAKDMKYFRPGKRTEDLDEEDEEGSDSENDRPSASLGVSSTVTPGRTCVHATGSSQNLASDVQQLVIPSTAEAHQNYEQLRPEWNGNGNEGVGYAQG